MRPWKDGGGTLSHSGLLTVALGSACFPWQRLRRSTSSSASVMASAQQQSGDAYQRDARPVRRSRASLPTGSIYTLLTANSINGTFAAVNGLSIGSQHFVQLTAHAGWTAMVTDS